MRRYRTEELRDERAENGLDPLTGRDGWVEELRRRSWHRPEDEPQDTEDQEADR